MARAMEYRVSVINLERYVQIVNLSIKNVQYSLNILQFLHYTLLSTLSIFT